MTSECICTQRKGPYLTPIFFTTFRCSVINFCTKAPLEAPYAINGREKKWKHWKNLSSEQENLKYLLLLPVPWIIFSDSKKYILPLFKVIFASSPQPALKRDPKIHSTRDRRRFTFTAEWIHNEWACSYWRFQMVSELDGWLHTMPLHRVPTLSGRLGYRQAEEGGWKILFPGRDIHLSKGCIITRAR